MPEPTRNQWLKSQIDDIIGGSPAGAFERDAVQEIGINNTPRWLKIGCLGTLSVPIVGGAILVIDALSVKAPEMATLACAGSLGLLGIGIVTAVKNALKK